MNSVRRPSYAFAGTPTSDCGRDGIQNTYKGVTGGFGETCEKLKNRVDGALSSGAVKNTSIKPNNQKQVSKLKATGSGTSQQNNRFFDAQAGVGLGLGLAIDNTATLSSPTPPPSDPSSIISDIQAKAKDIAASTGVPLPILTALGVGTLIFLLIMIVK